MKNKIYLVLGLVLALVMHVSMAYDVVGLGLFCGLGSGAILGIWASDQFWVG